MSEPLASRVFVANFGASTQVEDLRQVLDREGVLVDEAVTPELAASASAAVLEGMVSTADVVVVELTSLHPTALFVAGCALAAGKKTFLSFNTADKDSVRRWREVSLLPVAARLDYDNTKGSLVRAWFARDEGESGQLIATLLSGGKPRELDAVFAPSLPIKFQAARTLERFLERQTHVTIIGAGDDLGLAPLDFYVKEVYRSSAAIMHLLAPTRARSAEHNARVCFIAGIARGFEIPLLLVVEDQFSSDMKFDPYGFVYGSPAGLQEHVGWWLDNLPKAPGTNRRLGRLDLQVELPIRSFGQYVAEYEKDELGDYFIQTSQFRAVIDGTASVFVGRKGTGKTAAMSQAVAELRKDRRILVVAVKPTSYEFGAMTEVLSSMTTNVAGDYLMLSIWNYLLYTEIGLQALAFASEQPARGGANLELQALERELEDLGAQSGEDLSVRLERLLDELRREERREGESSQQFVARALRLQRLSVLRAHILSALRDYDRVAVLIDNLDKTWERGADYQTLSKFILALLTTIGRVQRDFARDALKAASFNLTLAVFLRTDIHDALSSYAREPDKIDVRAVQWHDEELLARVLEERFAAKRGRGRNAADIWRDLFDHEVKGLTARDYLLWRTLPRPRDFVFFANAALTTAIDRKHSIITASDITFAERQYSRFAIEALIVESDSEVFDLEEVLFSLTGLDSTLVESELQIALAEQGDYEPIRDWLVQTSFLGVEVQPGEFRHVEGKREARKVLKVAERFAVKMGGEVTFRVHPAFRADLEVRDDDLHDSDIRDITLIEDGAS